MLRARMAPCKMMFCVCLFLVGVANSDASEPDEVADRCASMGCDHFYDTRRSCQCNSKCGEFNNCCDDYDVICRKEADSDSSDTKVKEVPESDASEPDEVADRCASMGCDHFYDTRRSCQCNSKCGEFNNCCDDYDVICRKEADSDSSDTKVKEVPESDASNSNTEDVQGSDSSDTNEVPNSCASIGCGHFYDRRLPCQCNSRCGEFNNCCDDYDALCQTAPACMSLREVSRKMWENDVNRMPDSTYDLNYQGQVDPSSDVDNATDKLFSRVDKCELCKPTYDAYMCLLDNYDPDKGDLEVTSDEEKVEIDNFLDEVIKTKVMTVLLDYLQCRDIAHNQSELKDVLRRLWFAEYPRSGKSTVLDTSGFEHVMVGEFKSSTKVSGFHGWLSFYRKEKDGVLDYRGYVRKTEPNVIGASFTWEGRKKPLGSFFIGTSPEFDMAVFSLCFLANERPCAMELNGHDVTIRTYSVDGHVATAFIEL